MKSTNKVIDNETIVLAGISCVKSIGHFVQSQMSFVPVR